MQTTPQASVNNTPASSEKVKRNDTPTLPRRRSSRSRASCSSMSTSLMSIQEEDEQLTNSPSFSAAPTYQQTLYSKTAIIAAAIPSKRTSRKSVSFGPALSPEVFNKRLPPSTPVKTGIIPGGLRRSLPANFTKTDGLELVTEEGEEDGKEEEVEGDDEMVEYSMTGFEVTSSSSDSEEDTEEEDEIDEDLDETPVASPTQQHSLLTTPLEEVSLKPQQYRKLSTPLRKAIQGKPLLRSSRKSLPASLRKTHRSIPTPIRTAIHSRRRSHKALHTPIRRQIENRLTLRKTKRSMPTPLRRALQGKVELRKTKRSMPTPLRKSIKEKPTLRKTRNKALATPVRKEIEARPTLRKTKHSLPTPLRSEIESQPTLRKTKRALATPIRREIEGKPKLRKTIRSMPTPVRQEIESQPALRKTKPTLSTPLRKEIKARPQLCKTKKSLPTPLRLALQTDHHVLRKTKPTLPTPLRTAIQQCPSLRKTKKSLPADLLDDITSRPTLRVTKPVSAVLPTPLREDIKKGIKLRHAQPSVARSKRVYKDTVVACETPVPVPPAKRRKVTNTPLPYNFNPTTTPQPSTKPTKRCYATTVLPSETPVPVPPTKRMRITDSPALPTHTPYNFEAFVNTSNGSPAVDPSGLPHLFKSPRTRNSADPADMFEVRLFGESHEVNFASPLALSTKRPPSHPVSAEGLHSCLKHTEASLFTVGTVDPPKKKQTQDRRTRKSSRTTAITTTTRITRFHASKPVTEPLLLPRPTLRSAVKKTNTENPPSSVVTVRLTRSRGATLDNSDLKPSQQVPSVPTTRRNTRSTKKTMSTVQEEPSVEMPAIRPRRRDPMQENVSLTINTRTNSQTSRVVPNNDTAGLTTQSTRRQQQRSKELANTASTVAMTATKKPEPEPAVVQRSLRKSRRLAIVQHPDKDMEVAKKQPQTSGRRTRQTMKQSQGQTTGVEQESVVTAVQSSSSSAVPVRRSSRLRK